jgi:protein SCO1/2
MKTSFLLTLALLGAARLTFAADAVTPSCCSLEKMAAAKPLSDRSIYQLGATWTNDKGGEVSLSSLRERPVVIAMFFAQCEYACPVIVQDMKRLRAALPDALRETVQLVMITFDPARDTPAALRAYRARMALDGQWTLLRGEPAAVQELAMLLGVKFKKDARGQFAHSNLLTLLDAEGEIVRQVAGLNGDVSEAAKALAAPVAK